ncbi:hypothetical protein LUZ60_002662 [Juncus effusus]|nr:hypothetical protein LUZ60_002662 [Juncus effusus]
MRLDLQTLVGALKDTTSSVVIALSPSTTSSIHLAVLRATSHHPSTSPPSPQQISLLLSFGRSSRLTTSSLISALSSRLRSTKNPSVVLKSLLALHILFCRGAFIIKDQIFPVLLRRPESGHNPLALASFRSDVSISLSAWVRWFATVLELMLLAPCSSDSDPDRLIMLPDRDLIKEMESLVAVVDVIVSIPESRGSVEGNQLVMEIVKQAEEDWINMETEILLRIREMKERVRLMSFSDSVELSCVLNRLEEMNCKPLNWKWMAWDEGFLKEVRGLKEKVEELVMRRQEDERRVRREKTSESARIFGRVQSGLGQPVRFGSSRWTYPQILFIGKGIKEDRDMGRSEKLRTTMFIAHAINKFLSFAKGMFDWRDLAWIAFLN